MHNVTRRAVSQATTKLTFTTVLFYCKGKWSLDYMTKKDVWFQEAYRTEKTLQISSRKKMRVILNTDRSIQPTPQTTKTPLNMHQSIAEVLLFNLAGKQPCDYLLECCISLHVDRGKGTEKGKETKVVLLSVLHGRELGMCSLCCWWRQSDHTSLKKSSKKMFVSITFNCPASNWKAL